MVSNSNKWFYFHSTIKLQRAGRNRKKMQKPEPLTWSRTVEKWGQRWEMHSRYDPEDPELKGQLPSVMISWSFATSQVAHCTQASHETSPPKTALLHSPWKPSNHKNRKFIDKIMFRMLPPTHFPLHLDEHQGKKPVRLAPPPNSILFN